MSKYNSNYTIKCLKESIALLDIQHHLYNLIITNVSNSHNNFNRSGREPWFMEKNYWDQT